MRTKIQQKIATALSGKLSDATQPLKLKRVTKQADKVRGTFSETAQEYEGRGICRLSWSAREIHALNIPQTDAKAVILQNELPTEPKTGDWLDFGEGFYEVVSVRQDPVAAIWIVQYRRA